MNKFFNQDHHNTVKKRKIMDRQQIVADLFRAVRTGSLEKTTELLHCYGLSDFPALSKGYDFLLNALQKGYTEIAELLLLNNCRVNREGSPSNETTPLHHAVAARDIKIVQMLLNRRAEINVLNQYGETALLKAIQKNGGELRQQMSTNPLARKRLDIVKLLVESGADVNAGDAFMKPLIVAVDQGDVDIMEILLNNQADPNANGGSRYSLLHRAVSQGYSDPQPWTAVVQSLLNHGADPKLIDDDGRTSLHIAVHYNVLETVELLIDNHADINARDTKDQTPLHHALEKIAWTDKPEILPAMVNLLLERGADPNVYDEQGRTPLCQAVDQRTNDKRPLNVDERRRIIDVFLTHGADINGSTVINGVRSHSLLISAITSRCSAELIAYLLSKGAEVNPETDYESSPLYYAAKIGDEATVKVLLEHGATMDPEGSNGESILHIAVESGCPGIVERIFRSFYANNDSYTRRVKMKLSSLLAERFFERLQSWFKDRARRNTGITDEQYGKTVKEFLHDTYSNCNVEKSTNEKSWREGRIVMLLLSNGIDIDFRDYRDKGSLCYAIKYGDVEITRLCLAGRTKVDTDALNVAVALGKREIVDIIMKHDPSIDINASVNGVTPLLCAAMGKRHLTFINEPDLIVDDDAKDDFARLLVARGADVNARWEISPHRESVLLIAAQNNRVELVAFLMRLNGDRVSYNESFHTAARYNQLDAVKLLLRHGIDVDVTNDDGQTATDIACCEGHTEMVEFLLNQGASTQELEDFVLGNTESSEEVCEVIERHILRIIGSNECLSEGILRQIDRLTSSEKLRDYIEKCRKEVTEMRKEKIGDSNVCFYDIIEKEIKLLTMYARNESIRQAWKSKDIQDFIYWKFPMHYRWMKENFSKAQERVNLMDSMAKVFYSIRGCELIPELVIELIFSYLDDEDMKTFVEASCNL